MDSITPLLVALWAWLALIAFWLIAALFAHKTKSSESILARQLHTLPLLAAFYLTFNRHRYFFVYGEIYDTTWKNWIVYPGLLLVAAAVVFGSDLLWKNSFRVQSPVVSGRSWACPVPGGSSCSEW